MPSIRTIQNFQYPRLMLAAVPLLSLVACGIGQESSSDSDAPDTDSSLAAVTNGMVAPSFVPDLTSTITYLQNYVENALIAGYKAELLYSNSSLGWDNVFVRYTTNGWKTYDDVAYRIEPTASHVHATIDIPAGTTLLEYAVYRRDSDGTLYWDNNRRRNFKVDVHNSLYRVNVLNGVRTIRYITRFDSAVLHFGVNGWKDVRDYSMNFDSAAFAATGVRQYTASVENLMPADRLDFVVRDNEYNWDNNNGKDYFHVDATMSIDVYPTVPLSSEIVSEYVTAYKNGIYYDSQPINTHHSGYYIYSTFSIAQKADWTFVIDVIKDGVRYYGVKEYRADGPGSSAEIGIEITKSDWAY